jgi:predicted tellurium resistance membrane protein TerC
MEQLLTTQFWLGLGTIIWLNIILSGDNAVVIALAARSLVPKQQKLAIFWGAAAAVVLRIVLTVVAVKLLELPYLKLVGAAVDRSEATDSRGRRRRGRVELAPDRSDQDDPDCGPDHEHRQRHRGGGGREGQHRAARARTPDQHSAGVYGATMLMKLMERYPIIITLGAAILGWTAGEMAVTDLAIAEWIKANLAWLESFYLAPALGAVLVVVVGKWFAARKQPAPGNEQA